MSSASQKLNHSVRRMVGRDPGEAHRASTPLELLFDLTFVVAFSQAGTQTAHLLELGHVGSAVAAFCIAVFIICWAWMNYTFIASAYDNDDSFFRISTMVQMIGVIVFALGIPRVFESIDHGEHLDGSITIAGYVVMRAATVAVWLKVARDDPAHRRAALSYATLVTVIQIAWIGTLFVSLPLPVMMPIFVLGFLVEIAGPHLIERRTNGTPWHPHHIAERYGLLVIITLGEVILGTILAISAAVERQGWTFDAAAIALGGTALAFGLWWTYFAMPSGALLARFRNRFFLWSGLHLLIFGSLAAIGAGLHVAAQRIEGESDVPTLLAFAAIVIPVAIFIVVFFALYSYLAGVFDSFHIGLLVASLAVLGVATVAVGAGIGISVGILIAALAPIVVIAGYELVGHRRQQELLDASSV